MLNTKLLIALLPVTTVLAGGCAQNPCQNGKKCYDLGEDEYECICEEFAGKHCQIPPPGVSCQSSRIQVEIDRSWLIEKVQSDNHNYIYMGNGNSQNPACRAKISDDDAGKIHVRLDKNFRQCGTKVDRGDNGDYIYTNKVFFNQQSAGVQLAVAALVQWTCEYEDEYTVSSGPFSGNYGPSDDRAKAKSIVGDFNLATQAYLKPTFKAKDLAPSYVTKGDSEIFHVLASGKKWLSFETKLSGEAKARDTSISVQECFISSSRSPQNTPKEIEHIIEDSCPTMDAHTKLYTNGQGATVQYATNIMAAKRAWMNEKPFYFHCKVRVCPTGESCPAGCSRVRSQPKSEDQGEPLIVYSTTGPYFWQGSEALIQASQISARLHEDDAEHSAVVAEVNLDASTETEQEETVIEEEEQSFSLVTALALVSLLAVCVIAALITIYQRRSTGVATKERKIHRNASPINMNFAHEGSLRRTRQNVRHDYEEVTTLSGRVHHLPGGRPVSARLNYV